MLYQLIQIYDYTDGMRALFGMGPLYEYESFNIKNVYVSDCRCSYEASTESHKTDSVMECHKYRESQDTREGQRHT